MKKLLCIILAIVLAVSFTACGKESPEKAADNALKAIKNFNPVGIAKYFGDDYLDDYDIDDISADEMKVFKKLTSKMSWEILGSVVDGDSAVVTVKLTSVDLSPIITEVSAELLGDAFSSLLGDKMSEEEMEQKALEIVEQELSKKDIAMTTNNIDLKLTRNENSWKVEIDLWSMISER